MAGEGVEHKGAGLVEISRVFVTEDNFFIERDYLTV